METLRVAVAQQCAYTADPVRLARFACPTISIMPFIFLLLCFCSYNSWFWGCPPPHTLPDKISPTPSSLVQMTFPHDVLLALMPILHWCSILDFYLKHPTLSTRELFTSWSVRSRGLWEKQRWIFEARGSNRCLHGKVEDEFGRQGDKCIGLWLWKNGRGQLSEKFNLQFSF